MGYDRTSFTTLLREETAARALAGLQLFRACQQELGRDVTWVHSGLAPYGFTLTIRISGEFQKDWIPLLKRQASHSPRPVRLHTTTGTNAATWLRHWKRQVAAEEMQKRGAMEVRLVEWEDGSVDPWPVEEELPEDCRWEILETEVTLSDEGPEVSFWGVAASRADVVQQWVKAFKKRWMLPLGDPAIEQVWGGEEVRRLHQLEKVGAPACLLEGGSREEVLQDLASLAADRDLVTPLEVQGGWISAEGTALGNLLWIPEGETWSVILEQWLQSTQKRLKLLGFDFETVMVDQEPSSCRAGTQTWAQTRKWLKQWAKTQGVSYVRATCWDQLHSLDELGGVALVWRAFDPAGASWPVAQLVIPVEAQAQWRTKRKRTLNRQLEGVEVEKRIHRLSQGMWVAGTSALDIARDVRLEEAWQKGRPRSQANAKDNRDRVES